MRTSKIGPLIFGRLHITTNIPKHDIGIFLRRYWPTAAVSIITVLNLMAVPNMARLPYILTVAHVAVKANNVKDGYTMIYAAVNCGVGG